MRSIRFLIYEREENARECNQKKTINNSNPFGILTRPSNGWVICKERERWNEDWDTAQTQLAAAVHSAQLRNTRIVANMEKQVG